MNIPLNWLADFVKLPSDTSKLTSRLTMIGHMLDKTLEVNGEPVIDLELRGNRADLFGLIGIARDISAAWSVPITVPPLSKLPDIDPKSNLISVEATDLVLRFTALTLHVNVGASPEFIVKRLTEYGMASINNVVDITNYVMIETGIPLHAFDKKKLKGERLVIRNAKKNEKMVSFMGQTIILNPADITLADEVSPQAITLVGSKDSGTTAHTKEILLEAAVYNQASVRRTSRRLGVRTEAGTRLEKHLDPNEVTNALARAVYLLEKYAGANVSSKLADFYPVSRTPITLQLPTDEVSRLCGIQVPLKEQQLILELLGCTVKSSKHVLTVTVPTFRTDITEEADLVEEIARIVGYDTIPTLTLEGVLPPEQTSPRVNQEDMIRSILVQEQLNEVITSSLLPNDDVKQFSAHGNLQEPILLANAPDPSIATLRPSLFPNLVEYAKRSMNERNERVSFFEIGKIYWKTPEKKSDGYHEERKLGLLISGQIDTKSYGKNPRALTFFDLKGLVEVFGEFLGMEFLYISDLQKRHPSLDVSEQLTIVFQSDKEHIMLGHLGRLDSTIQKSFGITSDIYLAEISLDTLLTIKSINAVKPYNISPQYPPTIEDLSFIVSEQTKIGEMIKSFSKADPIIFEVKLLDIYEQKRTLRITYRNPSKTLTSDEVRPVRESLINIAQKEFNASLVE